MNILIVNKFYYLRGGAERSVFDTASLLERNGHRVIPFAMKDGRNLPTPYDRYFVENVEFNKQHTLREKMAITVRVIYFQQARERLERLLRRERIDLAHLHNIAHQISPSILRSLRKFGIPVVQTLHDYKLICPTYTMLAGGERCERCAGGRFYRAALRRCNKNSLSATLLNVVEMYVHRALGVYRDVDLFISPSLFLRRKLIEAGIKASSIFYLPNAIDTNQYTPKYGGQDYCLYFGRLSAEKGVDTLIRSMKRLKDLRLLIVGDGLQQDALAGLIRKEGLGNVQMLGPLHGDELKNVVRDSLFVVLPSRCFENCPFSILESFALGKPVIGSGIGGIPELITPGQDGLLFRPGDVKDLRTKMQQLIDDREAALQMGRNARRKVEMKFSISAHYEQLMSAYREVRNRRRTPVFHEV
jgi:glycosyltransferase involved in cell wall biosynthesis